MPGSADDIELALRDPVYRRRMADLLAQAQEHLAAAPEYRPGAPSQRVKEILDRLRPRAQREAADRARLREETKRKP